MFGYNFVRLTKKKYAKLEVSALYCLFKAGKKERGYLHLGRSIKSSTWIVVAEQLLETRSNTN